MKLLLFIGALVINCCAVPNVVAQTAEAYTQQGIKDLNNKNYQQALSNFNLAFPFYMQDNAKLADTYLNRAKAYLGLEQYADCVEDCENALHLNGNLSYAFLLKGEAELYLGYYHRTISDMDMILPNFAGDKPDLCKIYLLAAKAESQLSDYKSCIEYCNTLITLDSTYKDAYPTLIFAYEYDKNYSMAITTCNTAIRRFKTDTKFSSLVYYIRSRLEYSSSDYKKALADCNTAILDDPQNYFPYENRGIIYGGNKDYKSSLTNYNSAIHYFKINGTNPYYKQYVFDTSDVHDKAGLDEELLHNYTNAIDHYKKAISSNAKNYRSYFGLGNAYRFSGQYKLAFDAYNNALEGFDDPQKAIIYSSKGICDEKLGLYDDGVIWDNLALSMDENDSAAYWSRANCYSALQSYKDAVENYKMAIAHYDGDTLSLVKLYLQLGDEYVTMAYYGKAITSYNHALSYTTKNASVYLKKGIAYLDTCQFANSINCFNTAIALCKNDKSILSMAYWGRGFDEERLKQYQTAITDETSSITFNPNNSNAYYERGRLYLLANNQPQATADFNKIFTIDTVSRNYAFALFFTGKHKQALEMVSKMSDEMPDNNSLFDFDFACMYSLLNNPDNNAYYFMKMALIKGLSKDYFTYEPAFDSIRNTQQFTAYMKEDFSNE